MANPSVGEVFEVLRQSFQAIDLRAIIAAVGDGKGWQNVLTVIRFTAKTLYQISAEHERLKSLYELHELPPQILNRRLGKEHSINPYKGINIELSSYSTAQFGHLVGDTSEGIIRVSNRAFLIPDYAPLGKDLMQEEMNLWNMDYEDIGNRWPVYFFGHGQQRTNFEGSLDGEGERPRLDSQDLNKQSRSIGFADFHELVEQITGEPFGRSTGNSFEIFAPVYARITSVIPSSDKVEVLGNFHPALGQLVLECSLHERAQLRRAGGTLLGKIRVIPQSPGQELTQFSQEFPLEKPPETGHVKVSLYKQTTTRVDFHNEQAPLRSGVPAFKAFTSFVPEEDITEYIDCLESGKDTSTCRIFRNFTPKDRSKKNAELFEYVVTYLLGLCQLNPILLSNPQYDVIHGGLQAGSADIVASAQGGGPLLVSCTMAMPDTRKRDMLLAARTGIANRTGIPLEDIRPVLVTGKPSVSHSDPELLELAATDLRRLWEMCKQGNLPEARHLLRVQ